jgi:hypothetical protein
MGSLKIAAWIRECKIVPAVGQDRKVAGQNITTGSPAGEDK